MDWICGQTGSRRARRGERIQSLWSGYGEIVRVHLDGAAYPSVVVKDVHPPATGRRGRKAARRDLGHARKVRSYEVEEAFYRHYAGRCGEDARVPVLLGSRGTENGRVLLLEDLDASGFGGRRRFMGDADVQACLRWLANFHARFLGCAPEGLWAQGTYWHLATRPDELAAMPPGPLKTAAPAFDRLLRGAQYQTFVHGDAKTANFCFAASGPAVAAVDFQYVGGGCGMVDVCYLLSCMGAGWCGSHADWALDTYFMALRAALRRVAAADKGGLSSAEVRALEAEWRALYPVAWADFARFLAGWAQGGWRDDGYGDDLVVRALRLV